MVNAWLLIISQKRKTEGDLAGFDWHTSPLTRATPVTHDYRTTQNVRRFLAAQMGTEIHLDRPFMGWMRSGAAENLGDVADELARRLRSQAKG